MVPNVPRIRKFENNPHLLKALLAADLAEKRDRDSQVFDSILEAVGEETYYKMDGGGAAVASQDWLSKALPQEQDDW